MKAFDLVVMARGNLKRKKMRTFLTVLGIVIGTVSIVLMVAIGLGLKKNVAQEFATMGSLDIIEVYKGNNRSHSVRLSEEKGFGKLQAIDLEFFNSIDGVNDVAPLVYGNAKLLSGVYETTSTVVGIQPELMPRFGFALDKGQLLDGDPYAMVLGGTVTNGFKKVTGKDFLSNREVSYEEVYEEEVVIDFGDEDFRPQKKPSKVNVFADRIKMTMDQDYSIQKGNQATKAKIYPVHGVGILKSGSATRDNMIFMDYDTVIKMNKDLADIYNIKVKEGFDQAYVRVSDTKDVARIKNILDRKGYQTFSMTTILESINKSLGIVQVALGAIGGISLLVAAIGITNTMVMAISERRKEIGVMKVIGATIADIKKLFLIEAAMIGAIGGSVGILLCVGLTELISSPQFAALVGGGEGAAPLDFTLPLWLIAAGLAFTTMVGILSGYLPARKAMRSSALQALRTE